MNAFAETGKCRRKNQMPVLAQEVGNRRQHQPPAQAPWTRTKVRGDFISGIKTKLIKRFARRGREQRQGHRYALVAESWRER